MPKVSRTKPAGRSVKRTRFLPTNSSGIESLDTLDTGGLRICIYGRGKTGKTRLASTFPKPLLILGTQGYKDVRSIRKADQSEVDFVLVRSGSHYEELAIKHAPEYMTVVVDTVTNLQDLKLMEILNHDELPVERSWGMAKMQDWGTCGAQTKQCLRQVLNLADQGINVVVIAHERTFGGEEGDSGDLVSPTVGAALTPSVTGWLNGACDYICQTFIREETANKTVKLGKRETTRNVATGNVEFCLRIGPHPVYMTGFRISEKQLPEDGTIVNPTYEKIMEYV